MKAKNAAKIIAVIFLIVIFLAFLSALCAFFVATKDTSFKAEAFEKPSAKLTITDNGGNTLSYASSLKENAAYEEISPYVLQAFVATEDKRFYSHNGIDFVRLAGAAISNAQAGYVKEGGSTITQQLAKNALLSNEKTLNRKLKEAKLALEIEKHYDKKEILTMYLNTIYFGNGLYGITSASHKIFDKPPAEITLPEAAMLTGIVKNPAKNSPLNSPQNAEARMSLILDIMQREKYIDEKECETAKNYSYSSISVADATETNSYTNAVIEQAATVLSLTEKEIVANPYVIKTFYDAKTQGVCANAVYDTNYAVANGIHAAMVADNASGGVLAFCASRSYPLYTLRRQAGSALKPFIAYAPAIDSGYIAPSTPVLDEKTDFDGYSPSNYGDSYLGWTDIKTAVKTSSNAVAVKTVRELGVDYAKFRASRFGFDFEDSDGLSSALGGTYNGVTLPQMCGAYMTLASGGIYKTPSFISTISDTDGNLLYSYAPENTAAVSPEAAYLTTDMLVDTALSGTAKKLASLPFAVAAKTGTAGGADGNTDAWCMAYTSEQTVCGWYGSKTNEKDDLLPSSVTGGGHPALLTKYVLQNTAVAPTEFAVPEGIIELETDVYATEKAKTLTLAAPATPDRYRKKELFDVKHTPQSVSVCFDNMQPKLRHYHSFGMIQLEIELSKDFKYRLYKAHRTGDELLAEYENTTAVTYFDDNTEFGFNTYYMVIYATDDTELAKSENTNVFSFSF